MLAAYHQLELIEAGCDEAGRGCLAGPVFAAAVILPTDFSDPILNDSKQLNHKQREKLRLVIEKEAICYAVAHLMPSEIDQINIHNASYQAMHRALQQLSTPPQLLLIDGNRFIPYPDTPHVCVVKGDATYASIAAASILAKTYRDEYMLDLAKQYPAYDWVSNKGYPTPKHKQALQQYGATPHHRQSFKLFETQLSLF
jgi:ribonuclease HII